MTEILRHDAGCGIKMLRGNEAENDGLLTVRICYQSGA